MEICGGSHCCRNCVGIVLLSENWSEGRSQNRRTEERKEEEELDELLKE